MAASPARRAAGAQHSHLQAGRKEGKARVRGGEEGPSTPPSLICHSKWSEATARHPYWHGGGGQAASRRSPTAANIGKHSKRLRIKQRHKILFPCGEQRGGRSLRHRRAARHSRLLPWIGRGQPTAARRRLVRHQSASQLHQHWVWIAQQGLNQQVQQACTTTAAACWRWPEHAVGSLQRSEARHPSAHPHGPQPRGPCQPAPHASGAGHRQRCR